MNKLLAGPEKIGLSMLKGLRSVLVKASSEWIQKFLENEGLVSVECAMGAFEKVGKYALSLSLSSLSRSITSSPPFLVY